MRTIDADALFIDLDGMMAVSPTGYIHGDTVADMISDAPTVDAEPVRHGKWIIGHKFDECYNVQCDQCKTIQVLYYGKKVTKYCPECGAKMESKEE